MLEEFQRIGRDMFLSGLVSSHGGNISVRLGDRLVIKRRGAMLGRLTERDLVETGLYEDDSGIALASTELLVHRAIYQATSALAIVHAHPRMAVALSLIEDEIVPIDSEGAYLLHKVPVVAAEHTAGSQEVARLIPQALKSYKVVMLRGHGSFAIGQTLEEAYQWTSCLEESCQILYYARSLGAPIKEYRRQADEYQRW